MTGKRVSIFVNGSESQTTGKLMTALAEGLVAHGQKPTVTYRRFPRGIRKKIVALVKSLPSVIAQVNRSEVLVVHSALALNLPAILWARFRRKPIIAFIWDLYPQSTAFTRTIQNSQLLRIYGALEALAARSATMVHVPSVDYQAPFKEQTGLRSRICSLWPTDTVVEIQHHAEGSDDEVLRLAFAGQVNVVRGLSAAVMAATEAWAGSRVELHVFSRDLTAVDALREQLGTVEGLSVHARGFIAGPDLLDALSVLSAGLVALDPDFPLPAFPSKCMTYLSSSLPIVYRGPEMPGLQTWLEDNGFGLALLDDMRLNPEHINLLRGALPQKRREYFSTMEERWFDLNSLLGAAG